MFGMVSLDVTRSSPGSRGGWCWKHWKNRRNDEKTRRSPKHIRAKCILVKVWWRTTNQSTHTADFRLFYKHSTFLPIILTLPLFFKLFLLADSYGFLNLWCFFPWDSWRSDVKTSSLGFHWYKSEFISDGNNKWTKRNMCTTYQHNDYGYSITSLSISALH